MRQQGRHKNSNPEVKRRTTDSSAMRTGGGIFRLPRGKGFIILLVIVVLASYYRSTVIGFFAKNSVAEAPAVPYERVISPNSEALGFTTMVMATLDDTWKAFFKNHGINYHPPLLMAYTDTVNSLCSGERHAIGTFYCPQDNTVYVSLTLYDNMQRTLGAGRDFTHSYMIAHAVGHHIQKLLKLEASLLPEQELQADCFAGLWGHRMAEQQVLSVGDMQPAMNVAQVIEVEKNQLHSGLVMLEHFAYSNLERRYQEFNRGFVSGELEQCLNPSQVAKP